MTALPVYVSGLDGCFLLLLLCCLQDLVVLKIQAVHIVPFSKLTPHFFFAVYRKVLVCFYFVFFIKTHVFNYIITHVINLNVQRHGFNSWTNTNISMSVYFCVRK